ncbi:amidohydrolase family protein [Pseudomaricurvus alkylphenolicus]|uniref:amidohydrolase family protein n=1 Tax=Pseudomaricurvus alkylphenolicus TaxID=1306991 RepID=UPI00141DA7FF|nr:amidohydrolase family protein [Pseudomaricurvus alkylphenolicus]NIB44892.1 amidohydrolase family protein [Pseudomaricurvus alkylphenolicus]
MMRTLFNSIIAFTVLFLGSNFSFAQDYLIKNVNLIPMTSDQVMANHSVLIKGGKIAKICKQARQCLDGEAQRIDGSGKFLIPGLSDMHVHVDGLAPLKGSATAEQVAMAKRVQSQQLRQYLMFGVTTLRDVAGGELNLETRDKINRGEMAGPRLYTSYVPMDGDPQLHSLTTPFSNPKTAADFVRKTAAMGFDMVKIYSTLNKETFDAILDTGKEVGIPVMGHLPMQIDFEYAIKKGMRSIEHLSGYDVACAGPDAGLLPTMDDVYQGWAYCTPQKIQQLAEITQKYPVWVDPTLTVVEEMVTEYERYSKQDVAAQYRNAQATLFSEYMFEIFHPRPRNGLKGSREVRLALIKGLSDAGVPLLIGTDTTASGFNVHQEMALFAEAGLTPYQILKAATVEPARYFDKEGEFGTIVEGASAELVLLDKNPLADIANAKAISGVMMRGQYWPKAKINAELAAIQEEYKVDLEMFKAMQAASH